jgi:signal transduction histidine kinase
MNKPSFLKLVVYGGRLRNKIFLMMLAVGVVPIIAIGFLALSSVNLFHKYDLASIEGALVDQKIEEVRGFMNDLIGKLEIRVGFEDLVDIHIAQQHFLLKGLLLENHALEEIAFVNVLDPKTFPPTSAHARIPIGKETARYARYAPDGVPDDDLRNVGGTEKFLAAQRGENYVSPVYFTLRGPTVTVAVPVRNKGNAVISIIAGDVNLIELQKIFERSRLGVNGYLYLVDQDGFSIAHGGVPTEVGMPPVQTRGFVRKVLGGVAERGSEGLHRYDAASGISVVASGALIRDFGWGVIAEWPVDDADRVLRIVRNQVVSVLLVVFFGTIVLSVVMANRIVGPIRMLEEGTERVAQGKFEVPVSVKTGDEIEDLGTAFNKMMDGLKQLQQLKDEFVFIAAHELRTPVTAIKGYLSLILDGVAGPVPDGVREFIKKVIRANERLIQLVNDLLAVARSEAGRLTVKVGPVDVREPVRAVLSELAPLADEKHIVLVYDPAANLPHALADSDRLKEVLVNLVGNAIKYTLGSGTVAVSHEISDHSLVTHIQDTGVGISPEAQKKLFEKFYRVQTEKTQGITGTGLGLFIVKQIVEKMEGKIWVESKEGKGSVFSFSLPIAQDSS